MKTREEFNSIIQRLLPMAAAEHQATASDLLSQLSDGYEETFTQYETASTDLETLRKNNETLREVNAKLFLKVGATEKENKQPNQEPTEPEQDEPTLTFEALFSEKGDLL